MKTKHLFLILLIGIIAIGLVACNRSASRGSVPTPTVEEGGFPVPAEGTETMNLFESIATQTAMALQGGGQPVQATSEPPTQPETQPETQPGAVDAQPTATSGQQVNIPEVPQAAATSAPPAVVYPTLTPGIPASYTLQKGEYPYCIARRFNIHPSDLLSTNGLGVNTTVYPGTVLRIPQNAREWPGDASLHDHPTTFTVEAGESIYSIGCYFGDVDPNLIALANNLSSPYTLTAGQTLQIP